MGLLGFFLAGWFGGIIGEYTYHRIMHHIPLMFHIHHHQDFFHLPPSDVAVRSRNLRFDFRYAGIVFILLSPLMLLLGWPRVVLLWAGAFFHLVILYEVCHSVIHDDSWLPSFVKCTALYRWWKGCHFAHHRNSPAGNFCVTFPVLDWFLGTYVPPETDGGLAGVREEISRGGKQIS